MAQTLDFTVTGADKIHCAGCERRIDKALRRLPGVQDVRASHETQRVRVTIDSAQLDVERVQAKLREIGFDAAPDPQKP